MDANQIREILKQDEGLKLEFKQQYRLTRNLSSQADRQLWKQLIDGQWDELIKDIIALVNGNVGVSSQPGLLIIGADDQLQADGTRNIIDASHLQLTSQQIIFKVNTSCAPPIPDILCEEITIDGCLLYVISIPPTPYVHETSRLLSTRKGNFSGLGELVSVGPEKTYTEYTAFIRKGENVSPASSAERRALESDKKFDLLILNENLKSELVDNLKALLSKNKNGVTNPALFYTPFRNKYKLEVYQDLYIKGEHLLWVNLAVFYIHSSHSKLSTRFIEQAISSGRYLSYNADEGKYKRDTFLHYLDALYININRFRGSAENVKIAEFLAKYDIREQRTKSFKVKFADIIFVADMIERYEDVVQLSVALLAYLLGDRTKLDNIHLNNVTPIDTEVEKLNAEKITDSEIVEWVQNYSPKG